MDEAIALFREQFQIFAQRQTLKAYAVRFIAPPYTENDSDSQLVYGHGRNPERLGSDSIKLLLQKFGIADEEFRREYNTFYGTRADRKATP